MLAKVAIIDTGCDLEDTYVRYYTSNSEGGRIPDYWDFIENRKESMTDITGHGTHMTHLIFAVAKHVEVYPARVWDGKEVPETPLRIAAVSFLLLQRFLGELTHLQIQAIKHAVTEWGVDIISLSLSLGESPKRVEVKHALTFARNERVLVFAAAANNRQYFDNEIGFPAALDEFTICINSHDGALQRSTFSPLPKKDRANLAVLGEGIKAPGKHHETTIAEGTSISTIMAAGIGAIVLDYAMQLKTTTMKDVWRNGGQDNGLRDIKVMKRIMFDLMEQDAKTTGESYNIVKPWYLFKIDGSLRDFTGDRLKNWENDVSSSLRRIHKRCHDGALSSLS